jgi:CheY-like chemotaxis protein
MGKVLVIDDNKDIREKYRKVLETLNLDVLEAPEVLEVVNILMRHASEIDLILLDIQMPEVDGRGIYDIVYDYIPSVPIMVSSVLPVQDQKLRIPRAREYFNKADGDQALASKVKALLGIETA